MSGLSMLSSACNLSLFLMKHKFYFCLGSKLLQPPVIASRRAGVTSGSEGPHLSYSDLLLVASIVSVYVPVASRVSVSSSEFSSTLCPCAAIT